LYNIRRFLVISITVLFFFVGDLGEEEEEDDTNEEVKKIKKNI